MKTKLTKNCFKGDKYYYRDSNINAWLPDKQEVKKAVILDHKSFKNKTFKEIYGENPETFSLTEIEHLIETDSDKLLKYGRGNFFPVKSNDGVSVVGARRFVGGQWYVYVLHLDIESRWYVEGRFFSRNWNTLKLGDSDTSSALNLASAIEICKRDGLVVYKPM